ncbi:MAG: cytochrome c oxidase subunit II [Silicimonas sp.]|nr:cytochrome c oxidase subunit II [Silicimonas sp.]
MRFGTFTTAFATLFAGGAAFAQDLPIIGAPTQGNMGFQPAATELARDLQWLDGMILIIITAITLFVLALLAIVILKFNQKANPEPAGFTHNTPIEVAWTLIPILVLVFIGSFSLPVLFKQQEIPEAEVFIKTTGYQWYWGYEYPDHEISYDGYMIGIDTGNQLTPETSQALADAGYTDEHFTLATDTAMVVPTGKTVVVQVTGADVIHSWTIPAFGVKQDAVPGRLAELWFKVEEGQEGIYFGQCSELCGLSHAYMPITVKAVSQADYDAWVAATQEAGEYVEPGAKQLASNQ